MSLRMTSWKALSQLLIIILSSSLSLVITHSCITIFSFTLSYELLWNFSSLESHIFFSNWAIVWLEYFCFFCHYSFWYCANLEKNFPVYSESQYKGYKPFFVTLDFNLTLASEKLLARSLWSINIFFEYQRHDLEIMWL